MVQITKRTDAAEEMMIVALSGDFDLSAVVAVRSVFHEVARDGWATVLVDVSEVDFLDSAALGVLIGLQRRCNAAGGQCVLVSPQLEVSRLLAVTGLDALLSSADSVESAASLVSQRQVAER